MAAMQGASHQPPCAKLNCRVTLCSVRSAGPTQESSRSHSAWLTRRGFPKNVAASPSIEVLVPPSGTSIEFPQIECAEVDLRTKGEGAIARIRRMHPTSRRRRRARVALRLLRRGLQSQKFLKKIEKSAKIIRIRRLWYAVWLYHAVEIVKPCGVSPMLLWMSSLRHAGTRDSQRRHGADRAKSIYRIGIKRAAAAPWIFRKKNPPCTPHGDSTEIREMP